MRILSQYPLIDAKSKHVIGRWNCGPCGWKWVAVEMPLTDISWPGPFLLLLFAFYTPWAELCLSTIPSLSWCFCSASHLKTVESVSHVLQTLTSLSITNLSSFKFCQMFYTLIKDGQSNKQILTNQNSQSVTLWWASRWLYKLGPGCSQCIPTPDHSDWANAMPKAGWDCWAGPDVLSTVSAVPTHHLKPSWKMIDSDGRGTGILIPVVPQSGWDGTEAELVQETDLRVAGISLLRWLWLLLFPGPQFKL